MRSTLMILVLGILACEGLGSCSTIVIEPDPSAIDAGQAADVATIVADAGMEAGVGTVDGSSDGNSDGAPR